MALSGSEVERYARHIVLREVGGGGQAKLKSTRVLVIGAGGLGSPLLQYLAAAGLGTIGICDDDAVSLSNLQRQTIFSMPDLGRLKTEAARDSIRAVNPHVETCLHSTRITAENAEELVSAYDIVVDGSDNFATRYAVSDACFRMRKPLVSGAVGRFDGSLTTLTPYNERADGEPCPTYRCLFPEPPPDGSIERCSEVGILGPLTGIIGSLMAMEVLRFVLGLGQPLIGKLLLVDSLDFRFERLDYRWDPTNPLNGIAGEK